MSCACTSRRFGSVLIQLIVGGLGEGSAWLDGDSGPPERDGLPGVRTRSLLDSSKCFYTCRSDGVVGFTGIRFVTGAS